MTHKRLNQDMVSHPLFVRSGCPKLAQPGPEGQPSRVLGRGSASRARTPDVPLSALGFPLPRSPPTPLLAPQRRTAGAGPPGPGAQRGAGCPAVRPAGAPSADTSGTARPRAARFGNGEPTLTAKFGVCVWGGWDPFCPPRPSLKRKLLRFLLAAPLPPRGGARAAAGRAGTGGAPGSRREGGVPARAAPRGPEGHPDAPRPRAPGPLT